MIISLACHRCPATAAIAGLDVYDAEHQAERAGWVTHAIAQSGGRVVVVDVCPNCIAGAATAPVNTVSGLAPSGPCAAPRRASVLVLP